MEPNSLNRRPRLSRTTLALLSMLILPPSPAVPATPRPLAAQDKPPEKGQLEFKFRGKIESVDVAAQTLKVDGKVLTVTRDTIITKAGMPLQLKEVMAGDSASGLARQGFSGKLEAVTVSVAGRKK